MGTLKNLEGIQIKEMQCEFISGVKSIPSILKKGIAATAAGNFGAINIWVDDKHWYRCESMAHCIRESYLITKSMKEVKEWAKIWLKKIKT